MMRKTELAALAATLALCASVVTVQAAKRYPGHPKPRVPKAAPKAPVTLNLGDVVTINGSQFTVGYGLIPVGSTPPPPPPPPAQVTLTGYSPNPVAGGNPVQLQGTNFTDAAATATWNGAPLAVRLISATQLQATAPVVAAAVTAPVILRSSGQTVTGPNLTVTPAVGPAPDTAVFGYRNGARDWVSVFGPGQTIFIEGKGFGAAAGTVAINHKGCPVVAWGDSEIQTVCPALDTGQQPGPATLDIMRADHLSWNSSSAFVILPPPARFGNR